MLVTKYEIDMLDVEDADAFLIHFYDDTQEEHIVLVDAGRYKDGEKVANFIKNTYGTFYVDLAICTHCDDDHYGGLLWLVEDMMNHPETSVDIKEIWMNDPGQHCWASDFERRISDVWTQTQARQVYSLESGKNLIETVDVLRHSGNVNAGVKVREIFSDDIEGYTAFDGVIEVIGPSVEYYEEQVVKFRHSMKANKTTPADNDKDDDDNIEIDNAGNVKSATLDNATPDDSPHNLSSIIFLFKPVADRKYLFTGDAGEDSFNNLRYVSDWKRLRNIYWLKLPHHGSKRNITCAMINHFRPTVAYVTSKSYGTWLSKVVVNALKQIKTKVYASNVNGAMLHNKIKDRDDYSPAEPL
mgnify:CR=1 FL=1